MLFLILYVSLALGVICLCSVMEAVLLSVTPSFIARLERDDPRLGARLQALKADIGRPLTAILALKTVAHTVGVASAGAQLAGLIGEGYVGVISGVLTLLILVVAEIIPKTFGATYWWQLAPRMVRLLELTVRLTRPLVGLTWALREIVEAMGRRLPSGDAQGAIDREERPRTTEADLPASSDDTYPA